jgi:hypothetical protein
MPNDFLDVDNSGTLNATDTLNGTSTITVEHVATVHTNVFNAGGMLGPSDFDIDSDDEFEELLNVLAEDVTFEACVVVPNTWVFNLFGDKVDLVIQNHTIANDGVSNTQIRFYPNQTTTFTP